MITDEEIYAYLEHHGVKGQKWGVRRARSSKSVPKLSKREKVGIAAIGAGVGILGARFMANRGMNIPIQAAFGGATAYAGATAAQLLMEKYGDQKIQTRRGG
jgi:hypothetical protein